MTVLMEFMNNKRNFFNENCKNKFDVFIKDGEEWIYNSVFYLYDFDSPESLKKHIEDRYNSDKLKYLITGKWPNIHFYYRDSIWISYYYMQLTDPEVVLKNYFDFCYYTPDWPRDKIIELTNKYGKSILFDFCVYSDTNPNMSFDDWYEEKQALYKEYGPIVSLDSIHANSRKKGN